MASLIFMLLLHSAVGDIVGVNLSFNSQIPPLAHVSQPYNYKLASTTFASTAGNFVYTLEDAPAWLHFNGNTKTIWGTPGSSDVGTVGFTITAAFPGGSFVMPSTLKVADDDRPAVGMIPQSLASKTAGTGQININVRPASPIDITIPKSVFDGDDANMHFYATTEDHAPLPSWISFDPQSLKFTGVTPQVQGNEESVRLLLIASYVAGFTEASIPLTLLIGNSKHTLSFSHPMPQTTLSPGDLVNINTLRSQLLLDGSPLSDSDIKSAKAQIPSWLTFDPHTLVVQGQVPAFATSQNITVEVTDRFEDTAKAIMDIRIQNAIFAGHISQLNATIGHMFHYIIDRDIFADPTVEVQVTFQPPSPWLHFDPEDLSIAGEVPTDIAVNDVVGKITARNPETSVGGSEFFHIVVKKAITSSSEKNHSTSAHRSPHSTTSTLSTPTSGIDLASGQQSNDDSKRTLTIAVVVTCLVVLIILGIVFFIMCRPLRRKDQEKKNRHKRKGKPRPRLEISRPIIQHEEDEWRTTSASSTDHIDLEKGRDSYDKPAEQTPEEPPQIAVAWTKGGHCLPQSKSTTSLICAGPSTLPQQSGNRASALSALGEGEDAVLSDFNHSPSWGYVSDGSHTPHDSMRVPTEMARFARQGSTSSFGPDVLGQERGQSSMSISKDPSTSRPVSGHTVMAHRLLSHNRRHSLFPTASMCSSTTDLSATPSSVPYPPLSGVLIDDSAANHRHSNTPPPPPLPLSPQKKSNSSLTQIEKKQSIRLVPSETRSNTPASMTLGTEEPLIVDNRTHREKRDSFLLKRNRCDISPFFGSTSSSRCTSLARSSMLLQRRSQLPDYPSSSPPSEDCHEHQPANTAEVPKPLPTEEDTEPKAAFDPFLYEPSAFPGSLRSTRSRVRSSIRTFAEGFPRTVGSPIHGGLSRKAVSKRSLRSYQRSSWASSRRFEDAQSDAEDSGSAYSQDTDPNIPPVPPVMAQSLLRHAGSENDKMTNVSTRMMRSSEPNPTKRHSMASTSSSVSTRTKRVRNQRQSTGTRLGLGVDLDKLMPELTAEGATPELPRRNSKRETRLQRMSERQEEEEEDEVSKNGEDFVVRSGHLSQARRSKGSASTLNLDMKCTSPAPRMPLSPVSNCALQSQGRLSALDLTRHDAFRLEEGAKMVEGKGKRPVSRDGGRGWGSLKGKMDGDETGAGVDAGSASGVLERQESIRFL